MEATIPEDESAETEDTRQADMDGGLDQSQGGEGEEVSKEDEDEDSALLDKAQQLMDRITSSPESPNNVNVLHTLASLLEKQETQYEKDNGDSSSGGSRSSHNIGRLGNLVRENDEFFELISLKYLTESRYSISVHAASLRLLMSCAITWIHPHIFEEAVMKNLKDWVIDEDSKFPGGDRTSKQESKRKASDSEMVKAYSTGLLAVCLPLGGQVVEDALTAGISGKLMRYLRCRVLGDNNPNYETNYQTDGKNAIVKGREDSRTRTRQGAEISHLDNSKDDQNERDETTAEGCILDSENRNELTANEHSVESAEKVQTKVRDLGDDSSKRKSRGFAKSRGRTKANEAIDIDQVQSSPGSGSRPGFRKDKSQVKSFDLGKGTCSKEERSSGAPLEREDYDTCFLDCHVGSKSILDLVKRAVRAAEAEARAANAPAEAIKAAGDAAADAVKTAASEEYKSTNDEDAAVHAASKAMSTVIEAASAIETSRNKFQGGNEEEKAEACTEMETSVDDEEYFIPDVESLAKSLEKYCILCLMLIGEYVEVLGPVLHERGVDVCLGLIQRGIKIKEAGKPSFYLPDVLKLVCSLTTHRKFVAMFVDRGGIQKILSVPREEDTFFGLSSCLLSIGSLQGVMERVCALPSDTIHRVVELAIELLECRQEQAMKNAAFFIGGAFTFRAVLDSFDSQDGLQKLLRVLNDVASIRSGATIGSNGTFRNDRSSPELLTSLAKQMAYNTSGALRQYFRAHLLILVDSIRPLKASRNVPRNISNVRAAYKPVDISSEAIDSVFAQLQKDRKLASHFARSRFPAVDKFLALTGHITLLELCQAPSLDCKYLRDILHYALIVLHIVTLVNESRRLIVNATLSSNRVGIAVILDAANIGDSEIVQAALNILINLVCPPPSISNKPFVVAPGPERSDVDAIVERGNIAPSISSSSGLVGDRRIHIGSGAGCAGLAAQMELGYRQAREAVRSNNGIKVILHILQMRIVPLDCIRALACRVLLGLARDDNIAHILTKLQVGRKLSELIRDHPPDTEQGKWQTELVQLAIELIAIVTNSGRASTLAATDAATPTLRRIERAAIAAATPITYHSKELLLLIHEHLQAVGLSSTATSLLKEAQLTPLPSTMPSPLHLHTSSQDNSSLQLQWPSGRISGGFLAASDEPPVIESAKKKTLAFSLSFSSQKTPQANEPVGKKMIKKVAEVDAESSFKTPTMVPSKRKQLDSKDVGTTPAKRLCITPISFRKTADSACDTPAKDISDDTQPDHPSACSERFTLDSIMVQFLKHQHRQCPAPITTLPPLSLFQPHVCPEPRRSLDAPSNITTRLAAREFKTRRVGFHYNRKHRQFIYSRFRPWRTCRDDVSGLLTCLAFSGDSSLMAVGSHLGDIKMFDSNSGNILESSAAHQSHVTLLQSYASEGTRLLLSSSSHDVRLWDANMISGGPVHSVDGCKIAKFGNSGGVFAALSTDSGKRDILIYDVHTCQLETTLSDTVVNSTARSVGYSLIHFSPLDSMLLWNGVLWDPREPRPVHRFDQFSDYGGGGFHPAGNEVIINTEVWDLRKFRLLRTVEALDQTTIKFNARGDVMYAILRRNLDDVLSAANSRRAKHPLYAAFRTIDSINYSEIATVPVDRCVLDFTTDTTDSSIGLITLDDHDDMYSSARVFEIGRRRPTDDDSDPDDAETEEDEDEDDDDEDDIDHILAPDLNGSVDSDGDDMSNADDDEEDSLTDFDDDDGDYMVDGDDGVGRYFEIVARDDDDDEDSQILGSLSSGDEAEIF